MRDQLSEFLDVTPMKDGDHDAGNEEKRKQPGPPVGESRLVAFAAFSFARTRHGNANAAGAASAIPMAWRRVSLCMGFPFKRSASKHAEADRQEPCHAGKRAFFEVRLRKTSRPLGNRAWFGNGKL